MDYCVAGRKEVLGSVLKNRPIPNRQPGDRASLRLSHQLHSLVADRFVDACRATIGIVLGEFSDVVAMVKAILSESTSCEGPGGEGELKLFISRLVRRLQDMKQQRRF